MGALRKIIKLMIVFGNMASKVKITFLGTSAAIPTSKRNHTAILLNYKEENILFDCGEGTQRQFRKAKLNPCKISKILITHWHGDHVFGLPGLFQTLALNEYNKNLKIFGPKDTKSFMKNLIGFFIPVFKFESNTFEVTKKGIFFETEEYYLEAEQMEHGVWTNAYNFVIKDKIRIDKTKLKKYKIPEGKHLSVLQKGKDLTYDGKKYFFKDLTYLEKGKKISIVLDTVNNPKISDFVKGADIFISESSFGDEDLLTAKEHMHMAAGEVGKISKQAKVKKLLLTHISQRYEKNLGVLVNDAKKYFKDVFVVKDLDSFEL